MNHDGHRHETQEMQRSARTKTNKNHINSARAQPGAFGERRCFFNMLLPIALRYPTSNFNTDIYWLVRDWVPPSSVLFQLSPLPTQPFFSHFFTSAPNSARGRASFKFGSWVIRLPGSFAYPVWIICLPRLQPFVSSFLQKKFAPKTTKSAPTTTPLDDSPFTAKKFKFCLAITTFAGWLFPPSSTLTTCASHLKLLLWAINLF